MYRIKRYNLAIMRMAEQQGVTCIRRPDCCSDHQHAKCGAHLMVPAQVHNS